MPLYHTFSKKNRRKGRFNAYRHRSSVSSGASRSRSAHFPHTSPIHEGEILRPVYEYDGEGGEVLIGYMSVPISEWARFLIL